MGLEENEEGAHLEGDLGYLKDGRKALRLDYPTIQELDTEYT